MQEREKDWKDYTSQKRKATMTLVGLQAGRGACGVQKERGGKVVVGKAKEYGFRI